MFDIRAWDARDDAPPDPACFPAGIGPDFQVRECASRLSRRCARLSPRTLARRPLIGKTGCRSSPRPCRSFFVYPRHVHAESRKKRMGDQSRGFRRASFLSSPSRNIDVFLATASASYSRTPTDTMEVVSEKWGRGLGAGIGLSNHRNGYRYVGGSAPSRPPLSASDAATRRARERVSPFRPRN